MKAGDVVREIMKKQGLGVNGMAEKLNIRQSTMSERFRQKNLSTDKLIDMLDQVNYKLVAVPTEEKLSDDCFVITRED